MTARADRGEALAASCALDRGELDAQLARYGVLGASLVGAAREPRTLTLDFGPDVPWDLLETALAVERRCCSFFTIEVDRDRRSVRISVDTDDQVLALGAIESSFTTGRPVGPPVDLTPGA